MVLPFRCKIVKRRGVRKAVVRVHYTTFLNSIRKGRSRAFSSRPLRERAEVRGKTLDSRVHKRTEGEGKGDTTDE